MSYDPEPRIKGYLELLDRELRDLPRARRREVVDEIAQHIREAQREAPVRSEAELRTLLDRIGDPAEIAADADDRLGVVRRSTTHETIAIILLLLGGFLAAVGWFVGLVLLWTSSMWTRRDKLLGTLLVPGGLATSFLFAELSLTSSGCASGSQCGGGHSVGARIALAALGVYLLIGPLFTTVYLSRRLGRLKAGLVRSH